MADLYYPPLRTEELHKSLTAMYHRDVVLGVEFLQNSDGNYFNPFDDYLPKEGYLKFGDFEEIKYTYSREVLTEIDASSKYPYVENPSSSFDPGTYLPIAYLDIKRFEIPNTRLSEPIQKGAEIIRVDSTDDFPLEFIALIGYDVVRVRTRDRKSLWLIAQGVGAQRGWSGTSAVIEKVTTIPLNKYISKDSTNVHGWKAGTPVYVHSYNPGFNPFTYRWHDSKADYYSDHPVGSDTCDPAEDWLPRRTVFYNVNYGEKFKIQTQLHNNVPSIYWQEDEKDPNKTLSRLSKGFLDLYKDIAEDTNVLKDFNYKEAKTAWLPYLLRTYGWEAKTKFTDLWRWQARHGYYLFREKGLVPGLRALLKLLGVDWTYFERWRDGKGDLVYKEPEFYNRFSRLFQFIHPASSGFAEVSDTYPHNTLVDSAKNWEEDYLLTLAGDVYLRDRFDRTFKILHNTDNTIVLDNEEVLEKTDISKKILKFMPAEWGTKKVPDMITVLTTQVDTSTHTITYPNHGFTQWHKVLYTPNGVAITTSSGALSGYYYVMVVDENRFQLSEYWGYEDYVNITGVGNNNQTFRPVLPWPDTAYPIRFLHSPENHTIAVQGPILERGGWQASQFATDVSCLLGNLTFTNSNGIAETYENQQIIANPAVPSVPLEDMNALFDLKTSVNEGTGDFRLSDYIIREYTYKIYTKKANVLGLEVPANEWGPSEFTPKVAYVNLTSEIGETRRYRIKVTMPVFAYPEMIERIEVFARNKRLTYPEQSVTSVTVGDPTIISTSPVPHGFADGSSVTITGLTGTHKAALEGLSFLMTRTGAMTFTLPIDTTGLTIGRGASTVVTATAPWWAFGSGPGGLYEYPFHLIGTVYPTDNVFPTEIYDNLTDKELESLAGYRATAGGHYSAALMYPTDSKYVTYMTVSDRYLFSGTYGDPVTYNVGPVYGAQNAYLRSHGTSDPILYNRYDLYVHTDTWCEDQWCAGSKIKVDDLPPTPTWSTQPYQDISYSKQVNFDTPIGDGLVTTAADGTYSIAKLKNGIYPCAISSSSFPASARYCMVGVNGANVTDFDILEMEEFYTIRGYVTDSTNGLPIEFAKVACCRWSTVTDANGYYELSLPRMEAGPGASYTITVLGNIEGTVFFENKLTTIFEFTENLDLDISMLPGTGHFVTVHLGVNYVWCGISVRGGHTPAKGEKYNPSPNWVINSPILYNSTFGPGTVVFALPDGDYTLHIDPVSRANNTDHEDADTYFSVTEGISQDFQMAGADIDLPLVGTYTLVPDNSTYSVSGTAYVTQLNPDTEDYDENVLSGAKFGPGAKVEFYSGSVLGYHEGVVPRWQIKADTDLITSHATGDYPVFPSVKVINGPWYSDDKQPGGTVLTTDGSLTYWGRGRWNDGLLYSPGDMFVVRDDSTYYSYGSCEGAYRKSQPTLGAGSQSYYGLENHDELTSNFGNIYLRPSESEGTEILSIQYDDSTTDRDITSFDQITGTLTLTEDVVNGYVNCDVGSAHYLSDDDIVTIENGVDPAYPYQGTFAIEVTGTNTFRYKHEIFNILAGGHRHCTYEVSTKTKVVCSSAHGIPDGHPVNIVDSTSFDGTYDIITTTTATEFFINHDWVDQTETGHWNLDGWYIVKNTQETSSVTNRLEYVTTPLYRYVTLDTANADGTYLLDYSASNYAPSLTVYGYPFSHLVANSGFNFVAFSDDISSEIPKDPFWCGVALKTPTRGTYTVYKSGDEESRVWAAEDGGLTRKPYFGGVTYSVCKLVHPLPYEVYKTSDTIYIEVQLPKQEFAKEVEIYWDETRLTFTTDDILLGSLATATSAEDLVNPTEVTGLCPSGDNGEIVTLTYRFIPDEIEKHVVVSVVQDRTDLIKVGTHTLTVLAIPSGDSGIQIYSNSQDVILK